MKPILHEVLKMGLAQIHDTGLRRLIAYVESGRTLVLNGDIVHPNGDC